MTNPAESEGRLRGGKGREAFRTISEVADELDLPQHVLRFWESKFSQIRPLKRGGNRRYYRPDDVMLISAIKQLLHADGYTIRGVQNLFKAQGLKATVAQALGQPFDAETAEPAAETPDNGADLAAAEARDTSPDTGSDAGLGAGAQGAAPDLKALLSRLKAIRAKL